MSSNNSPINCPLCLRPVGPKGGGHKAQCELCGFSPAHVRTWIEVQARTPVEATPEPEPVTEPKPVAIRAARIQRVNGAWAVTAHFNGRHHQLMDSPSEFKSAAALAKAVAKSGRITPSRWQPI